ncbi:hypothetical protein [Microbulbifer hainanensis]|uniref:hypothetical protein n=1 Tax=Microbulbifer hainanensis TaxID=2735675 RepID=UPI001866B196|nr:hypothetical protein [Microbulbifer hainanensis]
MKSITIFLLMGMTTAAIAESDRFNLHVEDERLADVWQLVENFCDGGIPTKTASLKHPNARVNTQMEQVNCSEAYKKLRELDDGAGE